MAVLCVLVVGNHMRTLLHNERLHMTMCFFAEKLRQLGKNRSGLSLVEYALVAGLVSAFAITTLTVLGEEVSGAIGNIGTAMTNAKNKVPTS